MKNYLLLQKVLSKYPSHIRKIVLGNLLKAAERKMMSKKEEKIISDKIIQNKIETDIYKTEFGVIYLKDQEK